jgi:hypothetical protein
MSIRKAAARAGIADGTWRRIESARDITRPAPTVAAMAAVVGLTPGQLIDAGRPDAAGALSQRLASNGQTASSQPALEVARPAPWSPRGERAKATAALRNLSDSDKITLLWQISGYAPAIVLEVLGQEPGPGG